MLVFGDLVLGAGLALPFAAHAQDGFPSRPVTLIVPFAPGGGSDVYMRALAPFLEKHLPGKPTIIVRNVPGARSIPGWSADEERLARDLPRVDPLDVDVHNHVAGFGSKRHAVSFPPDHAAPGQRFNRPGGAAPSEGNHFDRQGKGAAQEGDALGVIHQDDELLG